MVNFEDCSVTVVQLQQKFSVFVVPIDLDVGENLMLSYIYGLICSDMTWQICKTVLRGLQGICETNAPLLKLSINYTTKCKIPFSLYGYLPTE